MPEQQPHSEVVPQSLVRRADSAACWRLRWGAAWRCRRRRLRQTPCRILVTPRPKRSAQACHTYEVQSAPSIHHGVEYGPGLPTSTSTITPPGCLPAPRKQKRDPATHNTFTINWDEPSHSRMKRQPANPILGPLAARQAPPPPVSLASSPCHRHHERHHRQQSNEQSHEQSHQHHPQFINTHLRKDIDINTITLVVLIFICILKDFVKDSRTCMK